MSAGAEAAYRRPPRRGRSVRSSGKYFRFEARGRKKTKKMLAARLAARVKRIWKTALSFKNLLARLNANN